MLPRIENAQQAAEILGIPGGCITIGEPEVTGKNGSIGQLPVGVSAVMFRGRAVDRLAGRAPRFPVSEFDCCPHEQLDNPGRVHVDPLGYVQICQGISIGNVFERPLQEIVADYNPQLHPIVGPILVGGPRLLAEKYGLAVDEGYADSCHLCYEARKQLRTAYPTELTPAQVYGIL
jgi:MoaA/NifB/PqqE/SkfB family radical SAM enzyme